MNILALSPILPDAPSDGDKLRLYHFLRELKKRHRITLLCFADAPASLKGIVDEVHTIPMPRGRQWLNAASTYLGAKPSNVTAYASGAMRDLVDATVARAATRRVGGNPVQARPYDGVFCYRLRMAPYALRTRLPRVIDYTDSLTRYFERRAIQAGGFKQALWKREAEKIAAYEAWTADQFDAGLMNSEGDAATLRAMAPGANILTAANGVDFAHLKPGKLKRDPDRMVFIGNLAYPPNAEAVLWFHKEILPLIAAKRPKARFVVLGSNAPAALRKLADDPRVEMAGFAADTRPQLWGAGISVCPVRLAAGRQNKILDAFATATPVVATALTAAGVEAEAGKQLLAADDAEGFARACLDLMDHPAKGRALAARALKFTRERYDWAASARLIEKALSS